MQQRDRGTMRPGSRGRGNARMRRLFAVAVATLALALSASTSPVLAAPEDPGSGGSAVPRGQGQGQNRGGGSTTPVDVLVFHGPAAEQDDPVLEAAATIKQLGAANDFGVDVSSDPEVFTDTNLDGYRGVVFLSAEGTQLTSAQEDALKSYVSDGNGFVGVHDAARAQARSNWFTGLIGSRPAGNLPTPVPVENVAASGENPPNETKEKLVDGNDNTKWLTFEPTGWVSFELAEPTVVDHYALTSANDSPGRDPQDWTLQGSNDGQSWTDLDTRTGQKFSDRFLTQEFRFDNSEAYRHYRLDITANAGEPLVQLAELALFAHDATPPEEQEPEIQEAVVSVVDRQHPATKDFPLTWTRSDQWLNWSPDPTGDVHTVAQVQEHTYDAGLGSNGAFHPVSWCRDYQGGRSFYTGMGATPESWTADQRFRSHLLGAIKWTTGMVRGDCQATIASNYEVERLTGANAPGELDQYGEMHGLTMAPDGTAFYVGKAACATGPVKDWDNPDVGLGCGTIHEWNPETGKAKLLATLDVFGNRGSGDELVKTEEGLIGITVDPQFQKNGWLYIYWMPHGSIDREARVGKRTISRLTYDFGTRSIDLGSRVDLLEWNAQIHSCCHAGGGLDFDDDGNLYIAVGDNNSSQGSEGYSGNNWTKEFAGISFQDARRTSGNTNNLNGKILRIKPLPVPEGEQPALGAGSTYSIPAGNLFPEADDPGDKTRPEIYVMGVRNPTRLHINDKTGWLHTGWVGPDAFGPSPELGPAKYDTATVITSAGNQGWPYCMGNKQPYRDRSNEDATILTGWYDCDNLQNTSPRNTGLVDIPAARNNAIWYAPGGGGPVFPNREGSNIPTYDEADATYTQPYLQGGCQAIMPGPVYHRSEVDAGSGVAWPAHWNGKWLIGDECNPRNRVAVTLHPDRVEEQGPPAFAETLTKIIPSGGGGQELQSWMGAQFGPDGALYMIDYGGGFFSLTENQKLIRIAYKGGAPTPGPTATATSVQGRPLTVAFTGERSGGVSYHWEFGDGATSDEPNPRHTYERVDTYTAKLTVTYADGETATTTVDASIGCVVPDDRSTVWIGDVDTGVSNHSVGGDCTVNDLVYDEQQWPSHGAFVSHVREVTNQLRQDGVLDSSEVTRITRVAARSDIGAKGTSGYVPIFDGTKQSLNGWTQAPSGNFELQPDGTLHSHGGLGMLWYSAEQFEDFSLKLNFRDVAPEDGHRANSGVFVRFPDPRTPLEERPECGTTGSARNSPAWVAIYCGQEVQIYDGASGEPQKTGSIYNFDQVDLEAAGATPKGEWNTYEVRVVGQHYTIIRNGEVINEFDNTPGKESIRDGDPPTDLRQFERGFVGLQNHGDADAIEFRNIRVRPL
jgi:glucose/arabinose dehydrogenase/type 1 glutamine amidotransferase